MTMQERQEIFAKEYLSIEDMQKLFDINYPMASKMLLDIKKKITVGMGKELRLKLQGKLHTQDYLDYIGVTSNRYGIYKGEENDGENTGTN